MWWGELITFVCDLCCSSREHGYMTVPLYTPAVMKLPMAMAMGVIAAFSCSWLLFFSFSFEECVLGPHCDMEVSDATMPPLGSKKNTDGKYVPAPAIKTKAQVSEEKPAKNLR